MKKSKKILLASLALASIATPIAATVACSKSSSFDPTKKDSAVMIVGSSGHNDRGFLQGAYDGAQKALKEKIGLEHYSEIKIPGSGVPDAIQGTKSAILAGAYNILGIGYQYPTFFNNADHAVKYKDRMFIGIDGATVDESFAPLKSLNKNVVNVAFKAEQSSFLSGVATGLYLTKNYAKYSADGLKVGAFGGMAYTTVTDMIVGYMKGLAYYNDMLAKDDSHKVEFIGWNGKDNGFTGGFTPSDVSSTKAKGLIDKKADVIFPVAGGQVSSVVDAIKSLKANTKIVGVDSDQTKVFGSEDGKLFITSSMKDTDTAVLESLKAVYGKTTKIEMGKNNFVGLDGGFVKLAEGLINNDEYKGNVFKTLLKDAQSIISTTDDAGNIYAQISLSTNKAFEAAKNVNPATSWKKIEGSIFGAANSVVLTLNQF